MGLFLLIFQGKEQKIIKKRRKLLPPKLNSFDAIIAWDVTYPF